MVASTESQGRPEGADGVGCRVHRLVHSSGCKLERSGVDLHRTLCSRICSGPAFAIDWLFLYLRPASGLCLLDGDRRIWLFWTLPSSTRRRDLQLSALISVELLAFLAVRVLLLVASVRRSSLADHQPAAGASSIYRTAILVVGLFTLNITGFVRLSVVGLSRPVSRMRAFDGRLDLDLSATIYMAWMASTMQYDRQAVRPQHEAQRHRETAVRCGKPRIWLTERTGPSPSSSQRWSGVANAVERGDRVQRNSVG